MQICTVNDCNRSVLARGWCKLHYDRWRVRGDPLWKSTRRAAGQGTPSKYWIIKVDGRIVCRHVLVAEAALGKRLPKNAQVHHVDGNKHNDVNGNLVICESQTYHNLLHRRQRALEACGHADWLSCRYCKEWSAPTALRICFQVGRDAPNAFHLSCRAAYHRELRRRNRKEKP